MHQRSGGTKSLLSPRTRPEPVLAAIAQQRGELRVTRNLLLFQNPSAPNSQTK